MNEDRCRVGDWCSRGADVDWSGTLSASRAWVLVADGMGGHGAGDVASSIAVDEVDRLLSTRGAADLRAVVDEANQRIFAAMTGPSGKQGMGTTIAGICQRGPRLTVFNVGDSRIYLLRDGGLTRLSVDDTPAQKLSGGRRSHALTQSLGGTVMPLPLRPHIAGVEVRAGDVVVVCSDGLTDMLDDEKIALLLANALDHPAAALAQAAVEAGGRDNVTVVVTAF